MKTLCVIPARIGSTRLKRKPLALIGDKPIVLHTYEAACQCNSIDDVVVATDSEEICKLIMEAGGNAVMTPSGLMTGTDRVAFVSRDFSHSLVVNLQGDEPFIKPEVLSQLVDPFLKEKDLKVATVANPLNWEQDYHSPDLVKVICDKKSNAIFFSRSPIPYKRAEVSVKIPVYKHMGLYAYKKDFLLEYTEMKQTPLELSESLEQLRVLENGVKIRVLISKHRSLEINTPEELEAARLHWRELNFVKRGVMG